MSKTPSVKCPVAGCDYEIGTPCTLAGCPARSSTGGHALPASLCVPKRIKPKLKARKPGAAA